MQPVTDLSRCVTHRVRVDDLERDLADPVIASRLSAGWSVATSIVVEEDRTAYLLIVLAPPARRSGWANPLVSVAVVLLGALVGAVIGGVIT